MIIGHKWLTPNKFNVLFETKMMTWFGREVLMKPTQTFEMFCINDDDFNSDDPLFDKLSDDLCSSCRIADKCNILPAKHEGIELLDSAASSQEQVPCPGGLAFARTCDIPAFDTEISRNNFCPFCIEVFSLLGGFWSKQTFPCFQLQFVAKQGMH